MGFTGMLAPATAIGKNHSVQVIHNPTNAANVYVNLLNLLRRAANP